MLGSGSGSEATSASLCALLEGRQSLFTRKRRILCSRIPGSLEQHSYSVVCVLGL